MKIVNLLFAGILAGVLFMLFCMAIGDYVIAMAR